MTLVDTDKNSPDRGNPSLNVSDVLSQGALKAHATEGIAYRSEDAISTPRVISKDDQIIVFDGVANKALFGRDGSGNYVVKVADDGVDVLIATDDELVFNSAQNVFKIVDTMNEDFPNTGSATPPVGGGGATANATTAIPHGLSFVPGLLVFTGSGATYSQTPAISVGTFSTNGMYVATFGVSVDDTNVYLNSRIVCYGPFGASTSQNGPSVKIYLLQETAN